MAPETLLAHYDSAELWPTTAPEARRSDVAAAYQDALAVRKLREARGEHVVGYKIGFTNRTIWQRYEVFGPIWGPIWNTTLSSTDSRGTVDLTRVSQPRLEPEVVFGIGQTPPPNPTLEQVFACIEWLAPGFEIVQSHCVDWKFTAAETVADGALHARLLVGRQTPIKELAGTAEALGDLLAKTDVRLFHGDKLIDQGTGVNVLDSPLHALRHFVLEQQSCPGAPSLKVGDVITTGTWTDAWPLAPGQTWRAEFDAPLLPLEISLVGK
jgi:2-keto-4-pentenoate hydratase